MNTKSFFLVTGIVSLAFGFSLIFTQDFMTEMYLTNFEESTPTIRLLGLLYGGTLLAFGTCYLMIRKAAASQAKRVVLIMNILGFTIAGITHIYFLAKGLEKPIVWATVALTFCLAGWGITLLQEDQS